MKTRTEWLAEYDAQTRTLEEEARRADLLTAKYAALPYGRLAEIQSAGEAATLHGQVAMRRAMRDGLARIFPE